MVKIEINIVEDAILQEIEKVKELSTVDADAVVSLECRPGTIGIRSQVLVSIMGNLEEILNIEIPHSCYIFRDSDGIRELTIREAAEKLIKISTDGKQ